MHTTKQGMIGRKRVVYRTLAIICIFSVAMAVQAPAAHAENHFQNCPTVFTDNNATAIIPQGVVNAGGAPETGDEIAVFNTDGSVCAGMIVVDTTQANQALTVWGDNSLTSGEVEGMLPNETMKWRIWRAATDQEIEFEVVTYVNTVPFYPSGEYGANRLYQLAIPSVLTLVNLQSPSFLPETSVLLAVTTVMSIVTGIWLLATHRKISKNRML